MTARTVSRATVERLDARGRAARPPFTAAMALGMAESTLQSNILGEARGLGWLTYHTHDSLKSEKGFPDLCLVHEKQDRTIFAELKKETGRQSPEQLVWAQKLSVLTYVEFYLWRPTDWLSGDATRILAARPEGRP